MKKVKIYIVLLLSSILSITFIQAFLTSFAQEKVDKKNTLENKFLNVTCYRAATPQKTPEQTLKDLENRLSDLEKQYKDKKIDEKTYQQAKENLLKQLEELK